jgi:hypothetical protein
MNQTATDVVLASVAGTALVMSVTGTVLGASAKRDAKHLQAQVNDHEGRLQVTEAVSVAAYEAATDSDGLSAVDILAARYGEDAVGGTVRAKRQKPSKKQRALEGLSDEDLLAELSGRGYGVQNES